MPLIKQARIFQRAPGQAEILGVKIDLVEYAAVMRKMQTAIARRQRLSIGFTNVYTIMCARADQDLLQAVNNFSLSVPDGMPLVWLSRFTDTTLHDRVYGPDLFAAFCELSQEHNYRHYFYGSTPQVLHRLRQNLRLIYPDLRIAGMHSPPFRDLTPEEENEIAARIDQATPDVLWIAIGSPRQEKWMARMRERLEVPVIAAIGAAFDFYAGTVKQAPKSWQRHGLEWLYRLLQEPRRLAKRYLVYNPLFVLAVLRQAVGAPQRPEKTSGIQNLDPHK